MNTTSLRRPFFLQTLVVLGLGLLLYPYAADWVNTIGHDSEVSGYVEAMERVSDEDYSQMVAAADEYNSRMPMGPLRDPYSGEVDPQQETEAYESYEQILNFADNGVIGRVSYPRLGIGLPLYHGTTDEVLSKGVGHIYGSSLPTGGPSTHSVLTSHSGLIHASLFTPLLKAELDDEFRIDILGEEHYYRVDSIENVLPHETETLQIIDGEDYITLVTCTPIGVNSHRMLVRGVRIDTPEGAGEHTVAGDGRTAGFPWWAVAFLGGSAAAGFYLFRRPEQPEQVTAPARNSPRHARV